MHACALNQSRTFHSVIHTYVLTHLRTYVRTYVHTHIHIASLPINITKLATHLPTYTIPQCAEEKTRTCSIADLFPTASPSSVPAALHQKARPAWLAKLRFVMKLAELWLRRNQNAKPAATKAIDKLDIQPNFQLSQLQTRSSQKSFS